MKEILKMNPMLRHSIDVLAKTVNMVVAADLDVDFEPMMIDLRIIYHSGDSHVQEYILEKFLDFQHIFKEKLT